MRTYTAEEVKEVMESLGMTVFTGAYNITMGSIRNPEQHDNKFDDTFFMLFHDERGILRIKQWANTTDPGLYWLKNPLNVDGTAIMVHDRQYRGVYKLQDNGHKGYKAWRQIKPIAFIRDDDRDGHPDLDLMYDDENIFEDIIYANVHHAGKDSTQIDKWSAACQVVANLDDWNEAVRFAEQCEAKGWGDIYSYALIYGDHFA